VIRWAGVAGGLIGAGLVAFLVTLHVTSINPDRLPPVSPPVAVAASPTPMPLSDVGRAALGRVVTVEADRANEEALGTAWLFDTHGDFVTNAHVVAGALTVRLTDRNAHTHPAVVLGADPAADIAVLRSTDGFAGAPLLVDRLALPAIPFPVVDVASSRATGHDDITTAEVTGVGQDVPLEPGEVQPGAAAPSVYHDMLALTGAQVFQGNSGGPVIDDQGEVVGVLTLASPNLPDSYAIPVDRVIDELTQFATRKG
jgi:serine protease Do